MLMMLLMMLMLMLMLMVMMMMMMMMTLMMMVNTGACFESKFELQSKRMIIVMTTRLPWWVFN
jgi:hypothetical protein